MNRHVPKLRLTPYQADYAQWCAEQGALLREGRLSDLDRENLAEEIESLGRSDKDEIESRLNVLLVHLLKWKYQPDGRTGSWEGSIVEQRYRLARRLAESPSLRNYPASILEDEYVSARLKASGETALARGTFPDLCPFTIEQVLSDAFMPENG